MYPVRYLLIKKGREIGLGVPKHSCKFLAKCRLYIYIKIETQLALYREHIIFYTFLWIFVLCSLDE